MAKAGRLAQIRETYRLTKKSYPRLGFTLLGTFLLVFGAFLLVGYLTGWWWIGFLGFSVSLVATAVLFGRRAERSAYAQIEGQPGAAAAVLNSMRGGWVTTPAIAANKNQDVVHRVVGRPGIILVSEGPDSRVRILLNNEKKRHARFVPDVPILEIQSGNDEGQVPLAKLQSKLTKLPRTLRPAQVTEMRRRLEALANAPLPMPKGPVPKSARQGRGKIR